MLCMEVAKNLSDFLKGNSGSLEGLLVSVAQLELASIRKLVKERAFVRFPM